LVISVGIVVVRPAAGLANDSVRLKQESADYLLPRRLGMAFQRGGGFLIVPGLMLGDGYGAAISHQPSQPSA
jgi:hypothetical protein